MFAALMRKLRRRHVTVLKPFGMVGSDALLFTFGDLSAEVADRLHYHFQGVATAEVVRGNLLDLRCDAIVSPANSFGDMSGGIDRVIDNFHRGEAQRRLVEAIREQFLGELPVGAALVVELPSEHFRFVVAAPTMRIPGSVQGSVNAYLSMRAALVAILRHNALHCRRIRSVAVPGLATGVGGLDPDEAAAQMRAAYDNVVGGEWRKVVHPATAPFAYSGKGYTN